MDILFVSPVPTHPPTAGNRARILAIAQAVMRLGHNVHFALVPLEPFDRAATERFFGSDRFHLLPRNPDRRPSFLRKAWRKLQKIARWDSGYVFQIDEWYDPIVTPALRELHRKFEFDAVCVEYVFYSKALEAFPDDCLKILDTHDCFANRHRLFLEAGLKPHWFSTTNEGEVRGLARADFVLAIQEQEAEDFRARLGSDSTSVVTVGHVLPFVPPVQRSSRPAAVFVGSSHPINLEAATYFSDEVLPRVREAVPDFEFFVAGRIAEEVPQAPGVVRIGPVPELSDAFSRGMFFVNPVRAGTGINIKLLEALAYGMPAVSTHCGMRGIDALCSAAVTSAADNDPQAFANAVITLVSDTKVQKERSLLALRAAAAWNEGCVRNLAEILDAQRMTTYEPASPGVTCS